MQLPINTNSILDKIRSGKVGRDEVITILYNDQKLKSKVISQVINKGGSKEDALSVFNLCLVNFLKTVVKNKDLKITSNLEAYIVTIARNVWYQELRSNARFKTSEILENIDIVETQNSESLILKVEQMDLLGDLLTKLKKKCKEVLMYWANGYSMGEIADLAHYKSAMMARKKKYQCMQELLAYVAKNPQIKNALI